MRLELFISETCRKRFSTTNLEVSSRRSFRHCIRHVDYLPLLDMPTQLSTDFMWEWKRKYDWHMKNWNKNYRVNLSIAATSKLNVKNKCALKSKKNPCKNLKCPNALTDTINCDVNCAEWKFTSFDTSEQANSMVKSILASIHTYIWRQWYWKRTVTFSLQNDTGLTLRLVPLV